MMHKKIMALLLVLVLVLAGCGSPVDHTTEGTQEQTESTGEKVTIRCQYLPQQVENPGELPVLKWVCLTSRLFGGGERVWNEAAALELNQLLAERNMPFRVQFVLLTMDKSLLNSTVWFTLPEAQEALKDADLIYGGMKPADLVEYLMPITSYVNGSSEPSLQNAVPHELYWIKGTVEDEIYGYCTLLYSMTSSSGWKVDSALLDKAGLTPEEFNRDFWEMDAVFEKLYAANGHKPFLYLSTSMSVGGSNDMFSSKVDFLTPYILRDILPCYYGSIGSCFAVDYGADTPVVVNHLETETVRKLYEAAVRYAKAKYTTSNGNQRKVQYTELNALTVNEEQNGTVLIPLTEAYFNATDPVGFYSGVAAGSDHPAEALSLLKLIGEDEQFRMQMFYGKEGRDYKLENGYYTLITQEDGSDYGLDFLSPLSYFCGLTSDQKTADMRSPGTENWDLISRDGKTALEVYQEEMDRCNFAYPIVFDFSGLEQELEAIEQVLEKSFEKQLLNTEQYDQMLQQLKAAGSEKVLAQLQSQLTQWQNAHPDW